jgi:hypothetical protein
MKVNYYGIWRGEKLPDSEADRRFQWLISHLSSPNGPEGRQICPWAIQALRDGKFFIGDARRAPTDVAGISFVVEDLVLEYQSISKFEPLNRLPETLTVLIPDAVEGKTIESILEMHRPKLTPVGLMLGSLDPFNKLRSLIGGRDCPYSSPWSFLTIRWMVAGDCVFLNLNPAYKEIYIKFFGKWPAGCLSKQ